MDRWNNKFAIVTGASSGIGLELVKALVKNNVNVFGLARRMEKMEKLKINLKNERGEFYPIKCDLSNEGDILTAFRWIEENFKTIDILVNNAGITTSEFLIDSTAENLKNILDVNLIAPIICTREAVRIMRANNIDGHIIYINSMSGHRVPFWNNTTFNIYSPSKFALKQMSELTEMKLKEAKNCTKVTTIFPGLVKTEMPPDDLFGQTSFIDPEDICNAIIYALKTPPHVQIKELTITPLAGYERK
ncbi:farnesol dehydrogenase-like [Leptopilina heterotoma]|uniref:farnesol dehydrogenase-like n=1 Tax=Leptopilina heterotoma TaxID=63436 RepID=UPI001CA944D2|nr:farnesol dehydrogenase-like [Leptopilina heterotoma]